MELVNRHTDRYKDADKRRYLKHSTSVTLYFSWVTQLTLSYITIRFFSTEQKRGSFLYYGCTHLLTFKSLGILNMRYSVPKMKYRRSRGSKDNTSICVRKQKEFINL
jgi:hypothetical protein